VYHLTWARVPYIVREMSGNFAVCGELSPCKELCKFFVVFCNISNSAPLMCIVSGSVIVILHTVGCSTHLPLYRVTAFGIS